MVPPRLLLQVLLLIGNVLLKVQVTVEVAEEVAVVVMADVLVVSLAVDVTVLLPHVLVARFTVAATLVT